MKKKLLKNERGDLSFLSIFIILAVNMILAFVLLFASVKINCINIRSLYFLRYMYCFTASSASLPDFVCFYSYP